MNHNEEIIESLIADYIAGTLTQADSKILREWIDASPDNRKMFEQLVGLSKRFRAERFLRSVDSEHSWRTLESRLKHTLYIYRLRRWSTAVASVAAVVALVLLLVNRPLTHNESIIEPGTTCATLVMADGRSVAIDDQNSVAVVESNGTLIATDNDHRLVYSGDDNDQPDKSNQSQQAVAYNTVTVPRGGELQITLSDGTRVWLNSLSEICFPVPFDSASREVSVSGECYFEVTHDPSRPFKVSSGRSTITVLGTSFNVKAYPDEECIVATLVEGRVNMEVSGESVELSPNMQARWSSVGGLSVQTVSVGQYVSWINGVFEFEDMPLERITAQLSRWYNVQFVFADSECTMRRYTGGTKRNTSLNDFLHLIEQTTDVDFRIDGTTITVFSADR